MADIFKLDLGEGMEFSKYVEVNSNKLEEYTSSSDFEDVLDETLKFILEDDVAENSIFEDFIVIADDTSIDSYGEEIYAEYFFIKRVLASNEKLGVIFYLNYGGKYDSDGYCDFSEVEGDTYVYKNTTENVKQIYDFKEKERIKSLKRKEEYEKFRVEMREKKRLEKERVSNLKQLISEQLLSDGFVQCVSKKGNLISTYEIEYFLFGNVLYKTFDEVLNIVEDVDSVSDETKLYLLMNTKNITRVKISGNGVLEVVKKDVLKSLYNYSKLYTTIINHKLNKDYNLASYMKKEVDTFSYYKNGYLGLVNDKLKIKLNKERENHKNFLKMMSEINKMF